MSPFPARIPLLACLLAAGCAALLQPSPRRPLLDSEGELLAELEPLALELQGLSFELTGVLAIRADGEEFALRPGAGTVSGRDRQRRSLLASGRLPPGQYAGFKLLLAKASLSQDEGRPSSLLLTEPPQASTAPFEITARKVTLLSVELLSSSLVDRYAFQPALHAFVRPRTLPAALGCVTAGDDDLVTLFDKQTRTRTEVLPLGRGPWGLALDGVLRLAYVALTDEDRVAVVDLASGAEVGQIRLSPGDAPHEVALSPDRRTLLVANAGSNSVAFADTQGQVEVSRVPAGEEPSALLIDRLGRRAYAFSSRSNTVTVLDLATRSKVLQVATEAPPLRGALDRAGNTIYIASPNSAYLTAHATTDLSVRRRVYVGLGVSALLVDPASDLLYVGRAAEQRLDVFDPFSPMPVDLVDLPASPSLLAIDDAQNALYVLLPDVGALAVLDLASRRLLATFAVGAGPRALALMGERR